MGSTEKGACHRRTVACKASSAIGRVLRCLAGCYYFLAFMVLRPLIFARVSSLSSRHFCARALMIVGY